MPRLRRRRAPLDGLISDYGAFIAQNAAQHGWFEVSTLKEPYRIEGKKTMGYELWEQFEGVLPDVIVYPTGGGVGLIGMWKAFEELEAMGLTGRRRPRMIAAQAAGCAPIVRAFDRRAPASEAWEHAATVAAGLRVPKPLGDFLILADVYASGGQAVAVDDEELMAACRDIARLEGILAAPESGAGTCGPSSSSSHAARSHAASRCAGSTPAADYKYPRHGGRRSPDSVVIRSLHTFGAPRFLALWLAPLPGRAYEVRAARAPHMDSWWGSPCRWILRYRLLRRGAGHFNFSARQRHPSGLLRSSSCSCAWRQHAVDALAAMGPDGGSRWCRCDNRHRRAAAARRVVRRGRGTQLDPCECGRRSGDDAGRHRDAALLGIAELRTSAFGSGLLIAVAWGTSVGGAGTPLGGAHNLLIVQFIEQLLGREFLFTTWLVRLGPLTLLASAAAALFITAALKPEIERVEGTREYFSGELQRLGPMSAPERLGSYSSWRRRGFRSRGRSMRRGSGPDPAFAFIGSVC